MRSRLPRLEDPKIGRQIVGDLEKVFDWFLDLRNQALKEFGLSENEFRTLRVLSEADKPLNRDEIASLMDRAPSRASEAISRLKTKGRVADARAVQRPDDSRATRMIRIAPAGRKILHEIRTWMGRPAEWVGLTLGGIAKEARALAKAVEYQPLIPDLKEQEVAQRRSNWKQRRRTRYERQKELSAGKLQVEASEPRVQPTAGKEPDADTETIPF